MLRAPGRPAAAARTRPERWSPRRPGTRAGPQQRQGGGGGGDAGRRGGVLQPSAACCFVSFRNTFPSLRKVSGAFAGVSSPGAPREARRARAVPPGPERECARARPRLLGVAAPTVGSSAARVFSPWPGRVPSRDASPWDHLSRPVSHGNRSHPARGSLVHTASLPLGLSHNEMSLH